MTYLKPGLAAAVALAALYSNAFAGGFSRGDANIDILFEDGKAAIDAGVTYVAPKRQFDTIDGVQSSDDPISKSYFVPNLAIKASISDSFSCALTYTQPFGASSVYGPQANAAEAARIGNYATEKGFTTNEYGGTCAARFDAGPGRIHVIGGVFLQDFRYKAETFYGTLRLADDSAFGYRFGLAYDIPEYAMRAQLMYRSEVEHKVSGDFTPDALIPVVGTTPLPSDGVGTLPQSIKLSLQSGIAPDWLVYGSVEWTDWSILDALNYDIAVLGPQHDVYNWRDGWTVQAGIGHKFNDLLSGTVNLTWDRGVGTGADIMTDTWTLGVGGALKAGPGAFQLGVGLSYLTAGEQSTANGATYDATAGGDWALGVSTSYRIKF